METIYFDRNVFADICELRNGLTESDVSIIKRAVAVGSITVPASVTLLEETVSVLRKSQNQYENHIKTVLDIINERRFVKQPKDMLRDDCHNFAVGLPENVRTTPTPRQLREMLDASRNRADLLKLADEVSTHFEGFADRVTKGLLSARELGERRGVGRPDDFKHLWDGMSIPIIESLIERYPKHIRRRCVKRRLSKLLRVRSVRFYTLYYVSLLHTGWFGVQDSPRRVTGSDMRDWFHAVQSAVANIFVTQESKTKPGKLPYILNQVPTPGYTIMNLREFVAYLVTKRGVE